MNVPKKTKTNTSDTEALLPPTKLETVKEESLGESIERISRLNSNEKIELDNLAKELGLETPTPIPVSVKSSRTASPTTSIKLEPTPNA